VIVRAPRATVESAMGGLRRSGKAGVRTSFSLADEGDGTRIAWTCTQDLGASAFGRLLSLVRRSGPCEALARDLESLREPAKGTSSMPGTGRWSSFRTHRFDASLTPEQRAQIEKLESLSYVAGKSPAPDVPTIRVHDRARAQPGLNFYTSGHAPEAVLMDMDGRELHRWSYDFRRIWPDFPVGNELPSTQFWRRAYLYPNGDILAIYDGLGIVKLDRSSKLLWALPCRAHHDLEVMPGGDIWVLTREAKLARDVSGDVPVLEDFVSILSPDGKERKRVSLLESLVSSPFAAQLRERAGRARFTLGANTLAVLDGTHEKLDPAFRAGNVLVSFLTIDTLAVFDLEKKTAVWVKTGGFVAQHDPKLLRGGSMLLFDNQGRGKESEVIEMDPATGREIWTYRGTAESPFYSETCGTAERLPNGNTLIVESDGGRAFEVTPDKTIVWEFYNPHRAGEDGRYIATLFDVVRLPPGFGARWIAN